MFYPIMIDLEKVNILIVGGGKIASRKARSLLRYGASIKVISPKFSLELLELAEKTKDGRIYSQNIEKESIDLKIDDKKNICDLEKEKKSLSIEKRDYEDFKENNQLINSNDKSSDIIKDANEEKNTKLAGNICLIEREFNFDDLCDIDLLYLATDDIKLNKEIASYCISNNILVNSVDNHKQSSFINTAFFEEKFDGEDIVISVSSKGKSPKNTKNLKNKLKEYFSK